MLPAKVIDLFLGTIASSPELLTPERGLLATRPRLDFLLAANDPLFSPGRGSCTGSGAASAPGHGTFPKEEGRQNHIPDPSQGFFQQGWAYSGPAAQWSNTREPSEAPHRDPIAACPGHPYPHRAPRQPRVGQSRREETYRASGASSDPFRPRIMATTPLHGAVHPCPCRRLSGGDHDRRTGYSPPCGMSRLERGTRSLWPGEDLLWCSRGCRDVAQQEPWKVARRFGSMNRTAERTLSLSAVRRLKPFHF